MHVNWLLVAIGAGVVAFSITMFRHREKAFWLIVEGQRVMFGDRVARLQEDRNTPMAGVGRPALFGGVIGVVIIVAGVLGAH